MEDKEIIELYFAKDERALTETAAKYGSMLKSIALRILGDERDSEECVNDAYLAVWNSVPPETPKSLGAFLGRVTRNTALNRYAYYTAAKRSRETEALLGELGDVVSSGGQPDALLEAAQLGKYMSDYLRALPRTKRLIFVRRYWYCDSIADIARKFGFSQSKVKSLLMRIRNGLKIYLKGKGVEL